MLIGGRETQLSNQPTWKHHAGELAACIQVTVCRSSSPPMRIAAESAGVVDLPFRPAEAHAGKNVVLLLGFRYLADRRARLRTPAGFGVGAVVVVAIHEGVAVVVDAIGAG